MTTGGCFPLDACFIDGFIDFKSSLKLYVSHRFDNAL